MPRNPRSQSFIRNNSTIKAGQANLSRLHIWAGLAIWTDMYVPRQS